MLAAVQSCASHLPRSDVPPPAIKLTADDLQGVALVANQSCKPPIAYGRMVEDKVTMDKIVSLSKRRGFVLPSSEIYGGLGSSYDYGHYGVLLKNNIRAQWWKAMLQERDDIVALDSAIIQHPRTWEARSEEHTSEL